MSKRAFKPLIEDILERADSIFEYTADHTFQSFNQDKKTKDAVLRCLEIIGEAANRVPKETRKLYPDVEWERIIRSRNIIAHDYERIDFEVIWKIVSIYLPQLKVTLEKILLELEF